MRRTRRRGSGGAMNVPSPFAHATDRAACFDVSPYQALCWREAFESLSTIGRKDLLACPIHGFVETFGAEITHRLCSSPVRPMTPTAHARVRAKLHARIQIPDAVANACRYKPALAAQTALSVLRQLASELRDSLEQGPDHERTAKEKQAARDLGLDPTLKPKVKVVPGDGTDPGPVNGQPTPLKDGDEVQQGSGEPPNGAQECETETDGTGEPGGDSGGSGDGASPLDTDGNSLSSDDVKDAQREEDQIQATLASLDSVSSRLETSVRDAMSHAVPDTLLGDVWQKGGQGAGPDAGASGHTPSLTLAGVAAKHPEIKRVLTLAGRLVPVLDRLSDDKKAREGAGRSRIENTTEISRLTLHERAGLAGMRGGIIAADTFRRVLEGSALGYQGEDPRGEGAIVICLDQSGSMFSPTYDADGGMSQTKQDWAQAVALALMIRASRTGRKVAIVPYDSRIESRYVRAFPKRMSADSAVEAIGAGSRMGGGTSWHLGLNASLDLISHSQGTKLGRADIVHITDGQPDTVEGYQALRERAKGMNVQIHGIAVGNQASRLASDPKSPLALWSDTICAVTDTTCDSAAVQALGRI